MRALEPEVVDVIWGAVEPMLPARPVRDPGRGHRPRIPDRLCFWGILVRLATGCSWQSAEALLGWQVSDTTLRSRRDEWVAAGVFELIAAEAIAAYDRIVGLDLDDVCVDGSTHKAPCGGEGTGKSPVDRRKSGWKRSIAIRRGGDPGRVGLPRGANRNDIMLFDPHHCRDRTTRPPSRHRDLAPPTADTGAPASTGQPPLRASPTWCGPPERKPGHDGPAEPAPAPLGLRWRVERTNSWLSNYGQLRRNTDRKPEHRLAQLALAVHPHHRHQTHRPPQPLATPQPPNPANALSLNPPVWPGVLSCGVREKGLLICDDCDRPGSNIRLKNSEALWCVWASSR